jgi:hypothetical protein
MTEHIDAARSQLAELEALSQKTEAAERQILESAKRRLLVVTTELAHVARKANSDTESADQYNTLIEERGLLNRVIARASKALTR